MPLCAANEVKPEYFSNDRQHSSDIRCVTIIEQAPKKSDRDNTMVKMKHIKLNDSKYIHPQNEKKK